MKEVVLNATLRTTTGKKTRAMRRNGLIPGIYYIHGETPVSVTAPEAAVVELESGEAHIVLLKLEDGSERQCILRELSLDPVSDRPVHFDLQGVRADEKIRVEVPVVLKGVAAGVREGGMVQHILHRLRVECLPSAIPEHVEVDISALTINMAIHVRDLTIEGVHILDAGVSTVVSVIPPVVEKAATEVAADAAATPAEPEVIKKGKEEKEED
jgi:large subunit ribosomal protein L25